MSNPCELLFDCKPIDWGNFEVELSDMEKEKLLEEVYRMELFEFLNGQDLLDKSNFHFVNLNNNEYVDIVYHGYAMTESNRILFLKNNGDNFAVIIDLFGEMKALEIEKSRNSFSFCILNYPCCAGTTFHLEKYTYYYKKERLQLDQKIAYLEGTKFPERIAFNKIFETANELYRLRIQPLIDHYYPDLFFTYLNGKGNIIAEFVKGTEGRAVAEFKDDMGRVWWFVIISKDAKSRKTVFHRGDNNNELFEFAGWMSSRFLIEPEIMDEFE